MADATATIARDYQDMVGNLKFKIKSAETLVRGGLCGVSYATGLVENADDTAGLIPCGVCVSPSQGGESLLGTALATEADPGATVRGGVVLPGVTVTGVSAYADIGSAVYNTDNQTMTLTRPADDAAVMGFITYKSRASTDTTCDIYALSFVDSCLLGLAGGNKKQVCVGYISGNDLLDATDNAVALTKVMFGHGKITNITARSAGYDTDWTAGSMILNASIAGTTIKDSTPAAITLTLTEASIDAATDRGTLISCTTIDSANVFSDGDVLLLDIVNSASTAFSKTAGTGWGGGWNIYADVEYLPGA